MFTKDNWVAFDRSVLAHKIFFKGLLLPYHWIFVLTRFAFPLFILRIASRKLTDLDKRMLAPGFDRLCYGYFFGQQGQGCWKESTKVVALRLSSRLFVVTIVSVILPFYRRGLRAAPWPSSLLFQQKCCLIRDFNRRASFAGTRLFVNKVHWLVCI